MAHHGGLTMSGKDEINELEFVRRSIKLLKEREERLKAERFNLPNDEKIRVIVELKQELIEMRNSKNREMRRTIEEVEMEMLKNMVIPLLPTLEWEEHRYTHNGGAIRANLPDFIRDVISPMFPSYREVSFMHTEDVEVILSNHNIALAGSGALAYAINVLGMDPTVSEEKFRKRLQSQIAARNGEQGKLDDLQEEYDSLFG